MDYFGDRLKKMREANVLTYKKLSGLTQIDQAILCKIESGDRKATREQVLKLAQAFKVAEQELLTEWLSDNLAYTLTNEPAALKALELAEEKIKYRTAK